MPAAGISIRGRDGSATAPAPERSRIEPPKSWSADCNATAVADKEPGAAALSHHVEASGGRLEVRATFPARTVELKIGKGDELRRRYAAAPPPLLSGKIR